MTCSTTELQRRQLKENIQIIKITGNEKIDAEKLISQLFHGSSILRNKGTANAITERM